MTSGTENIHLDTGTPDSRRKSMGFLGESEGSLPPLCDSFPDAGEAITDFWSMSGNFIFRHHVELSVKLYSPRRITPYSTEVHWCIQNYSYQFGCQARETRIDDYWNIDGSRDLSDPWTGFTQIGLLEETLPNGFLWSEKDSRENTWHQDQIIYGQNSRRKWEEMPSWRKGKSGHMKNLNSIMQDNYEESISVHLRTRNLRRPSRMLARNWKHRWLPLCHAKLPRTMWNVGVVHPIKSNQDLRLFWKPVNLQDFIWENHCRLIRKTILQEKEAMHYSIIIWFTNLFVCLTQAMKIPAAKAAVDKKWENRRKFRRGIWRKAEVRKRWLMKQGRRAQKFILHH